MTDLTPAEIEIVDKIAQTILGDSVSCFKYADVLETVRTLCGFGAGYRSGVEDAANIADKYTCGLCGMDGQAGREIRALTPPAEDPREEVKRLRIAFEALEQIAKRTEYYPDDGVGWLAKEAVDAYHGAEATP